MNNIKYTKEDVEELLKEEASVIQNLESELSYERKYGIMKKYIKKLDLCINFFRELTDEQVEVQVVTDKIEQFKEIFAKLPTQIDDMLIASNEWEGYCSRQKDQIRQLCQNLEACVEKLEMYGISSDETTELVKGKKAVEELQLLLDNANIQIHEGEAHNEKLKKTIEELKKNKRGKKPMTNIGCG